MATVESLYRAIGTCMLRERRAFEQRLDGLRRQLSFGRDISQKFFQLERDVMSAVERREQRARSIPELFFPEQLPIVERKVEIAAAIREHPVVVICGETGSGKSTQLPKICLEVGRGVEGLIGHTQPRRIAARTLAARIASELHAEVGGAVGYKVRFGDHVGPNTYIKLMTDGILLAEIESDRLLYQYDTLIIDEAHERSLNIDFILGYLARLVEARRDLKIIVTSATIDATRFSTHFGGAPVLEIGGRTYPVDIRYRANVSPDDDDDDDDDDELSLGDRISIAVGELSREGRGDILVFLPTERTIREVAERLGKDDLSATEILPLFARLSPAEQNRIFDPRGGRRIVLATNVAETSLTVPGIRYVIDAGLARLRRYDPRRGVERLPIERVSRASANQRAGRCGRTSAGICIRLYSEEDFLGRDEFTTPEITRSNLAGVILRMAALGLGTIDEFPFLDAPDRRAAKDAYDALIELGAIDEEHRVTPTGKNLARLPVDPRIGRMLLASHELGCVSEVLVIAAALSTQDPHERPLDQREQADQAHRKFQAETSDFAGMLLLFRAFEAEGATKAKLRAFCKKNFLSFTRMREWIDIRAQLEEQLRELALDARGGGAKAAADDVSVHRALLTGLLRNVALRFDDRTYLGARNVKLGLHPSSALKKKRPQWIVAAEVVETERLYARTVAKIDPEWIEDIAGHVVTRSYAEPRWDAKRGQVVAEEKVALYGLPVARHRVDYGRIDAEGAREIFIRSALVAGEIQTHGAFYRHNVEIMRSLDGLADRMRGGAFAIDESQIFPFFDERVPPEVHSTISFERWRKLSEQENPRLLFLDRDQIAGKESVAITETTFPAELTVGGHRLALRYRFAPGEEDDGITAIVPLPIVHLLPAAPFEWLVPGMLVEKIDALIESLPKALRRALPIANDLPARLGATASHIPLTVAIAAELSEMKASIRADDFRPELVREHLIMRFEVVDEAGKVVAVSRDLPALARRFAERAHESYQRVAKESLERESVKGWDFGDLPERVELRHGQATIAGFPALHNENGRVALRVFDSAERAALAHRAGSMRLFDLELADVGKSVRRAISTAVCLQYVGLGSADELRDDIVQGAIAHAILEGRDPVYSASEFALRAREARGKLARHAAEIARTTGEILEIYQRALQKTGRSTTAKGARAHLARLVPRGFVLTTPPAVLPKMPRYLKAIEVRIERGQHNPAKYREREAQIEALFDAYQKSLAERPAGDKALEHYRWLLEEFHVFLFAQELAASEVVTEKRLATAWQAAHRRWTLHAASRQ